MCILAKDKRFCSFFTEIFYCHWTSIHFRMHICILIITFIMYKSCTVFFMDHFRTGTIVFTKSSLISHRPENNRCMVLISFYHILNTVKKHGFPFFSITRNVNVISKKTMRLIICLIHNINTIFITKLVKTRIIRIMRCTNCI